MSSKNWNNDHLAHEGLIAREIGGHWGLVPKLARLAVKGKSDSWNGRRATVCVTSSDIARGK